MKLKQSRMLTKEAPASWLNLAVGTLRPIQILSQSITIKSIEDKPGLAATTMAIGQLCAQACEFSLKGLLYAIDADLGKTHSCTQLFALLPQHMQKELKDHFRQDHPPTANNSQMALPKFLAECADKNVAWRYFEGANMDINATESFVKACYKCFNKLPV